MARPKGKGPVIAGVVFITAFLIAMAWTTLGNSQYKVEVCQGFGGRSVCKGGAATTKEEAQRIATVSACSDLTRGMTELIQCQNSTPVSVTWKQ
jgi:Leu/Phe-tRNA-protein transferase